MRFIKSLLVGILISSLILLVGFSFLGGLGAAVLFVGGPILILVLVFVLIVLVYSVVYGIRNQTNRASISEKNFAKQTVFFALIISAIFIIMLNISVFTVIIPNLIRKPMAQAQLKKDLYTAPTYIPLGLQYRGADFHQPDKFPSYIIYYNCDNDPKGLEINQYLPGDPDYTASGIKDTEGSIVSINGLQGVYQETWFSKDLLIDAGSNLRIDLHLYSKNQCNLQNPQEELIKMAQSMKMSSK